MISKNKNPEIFNIIIEYYHKNNNIKYKLDWETMIKNNNDFLILKHLKKIFRRFNK